MATRTAMVDTSAVFTKNLPFEKGQGTGSNRPWSSTRESTSLDAEKRPNSVAFGSGGSRRHRSGPTTLARTRTRVRGVLHGRPRRRDRERRAADDPGRPEHLPEHAAVDRHR